MVIIIEGCDATGKTSLAKHIEQKFSFLYYKEPLSYQERLSPSYNSFNHYFELADYLIKRHENFICDRLHLGDAVNPIVRKDGRTPLSLEQIKEIEFPFNENNCILILSSTSLNFIINGFKSRGEDVAQEKDIKYLQYLYNLFFNLSTIKNKYIFNVENDSDYSKIDKYILGFIK